MSIHLCPDEIGAAAHALTYVAMCGDWFWHRMTWWRRR